MPPHLHPRSRLTSSLFATTLFASFFVVALPHVLPCPAPRIAFADDGTPEPRKRRRKCPADAKTKVDEAVNALSDRELAEGGTEQDESEIRRQMALKRECPVPKPGGVVGEILGFKNKDNHNLSSRGEGKRPP